VFAERTKSIVANIIHEDQTIFIPNRYIGTNINTFLKLQEKLNQENIKGYALLVDIEKTYHTLNREFLGEVLKAFKFGPIFCKWVGLIHNLSEAQIMINGFLSKPCTINSGARQGCPWAPVLFVCAIEPLACSIRESCVKEITLDEHYGLNIKDICI
jgi:Reverse transcriptase (RNA-dependent DNA polymerase)